MLPGAAYTEKSGTYVNPEGRVQRTARAVDPPGDAREDWSVLVAISQAMGKPLPYSSLAELRQRMCTIAPHLADNEMGVQAASAELSAAMLGTEGAPHLTLTLTLSLAWMLGTKGAPARKPNAEPNPDRDPNEPEPQPQPQPQPQLQPQPQP